MQPKLIETLYKIRDRVTKHWIKGALVRDGAGDRLNGARAPGGCEWCLLGAIQYEAHEDQEAYEAHNLESKLINLVVTDIKERNPYSQTFCNSAYDLQVITGYNDRAMTKKEDILAVLDNVIQKVQTDAIPHS